MNNIFLRGWRVESGDTLLFSHPTYELLSVKIWPIDSNLLPPELIMASLSSKKIAKSNALALKELHTISFVVNAVAILCHWFFRRPKSIWIYVAFSVPAIICQCILETRGRPTQIQGQTRSLDNIRGPGLYEYMFDCIYVTWACATLMTISGSNKVWFLYLVIPSFLIYKSLGLFQSIRLFGETKKGKSDKASLLDTKAPDAKPPRRKKGLRS